MTRYVLRRVAFSLVTLWLVVTIVFMINNVFPSDVGRRLAGPFQSQAVVDEINEELGTNDPLIVQYGRMLKSVVTLDFADSYVQNKPATEVTAAFWRRSSSPPMRSCRRFRSASRWHLCRPKTGKAGGSFGRDDRLASSSIPEFVCA
jgi:hypothetical protein